MSKLNLSRRQFLQSAFYSGLLYGSGALPGIIRNVGAQPAPLQNRVLANLFMNGGPDLRHLVVPEFSSLPGSFGDAYWSNRTRSHNLADSGQTPEQRWNEDYYPITVGGTNWTGGLVDQSGLNSGITFGIWREAGWLIDMFKAGHVALVFNAVGGTNRAHDLSSLMLNQGNLLSTLNNQDRSGWGGRLARSAGGTSISLTNSPSSFNFGPLGDAPNYDPDKIDNSDLISVENAREMGLFDFNPESNQITNQDDKMARAAKSYYAALRQENIHQAYLKALDHEQKVREFGDLIQARLQDIPVPTLIQALYSTVDGINPDPNNVNSTGRRVLFRTSLGVYMRNLYDVIVTNDLLNPSVMSFNYGGWDTHSGQRPVPAILASDPTNPFSYRGIESGLRDIFEGQYGASPVNPNAWHGGLSALWASLTAADRSKMVFTIAGEFGRQIRDNGDAGTDHGKGNLMFVISESCQGGVYGEMFQQDEIPKYDLPVNQTPDIDPKTEIDHIFAKVSDWVAPGSGTSVFPRTSPSYTDDPPIIEIPGMFDNLMI
ncbi:MAG: DUF1501 domain-containing protein [Gammaproteobacteria bacterium]|nr:DUF1501 domain-containing protein [Gammaproteobacteria bacterium]